MGFSKKELAQRIYALVCVEASKDVARGAEVKPDMMVNAALACIHFAELFEISWLDYNQTSAKVNE